MIRIRILEHTFADGRIVEPGELLDVDEGHYGTQALLASKKAEKVEGGGDDEADEAAPSPQHADRRPKRTR